jgi:predicted PurR-regulated permease PerM
MGGMGLSILNGTRAALGQVLTLGVVLFFLLASGDGLLRSLVEILPTFGDKRRVVEIANEIERNISGYLATITMMNVFVGLANGISMYLLGMPDPLLWGVVAFLLNYIPILGPVTGIVIFFFVGLFSSPSLLMALLPPAIYFGVHVIEGETVTPMLLARRFTLNPVLVIVALFFWDWLWGVPGAFLAVPLLAITKIVCDRIPSLTPLGHLLGASRKTGPTPATTP